MAEDKETTKEEWHKKRFHMGHGASGGVYGLAFIGAFVYYMQHADTFWVGVLGFLKALIWPALLIHKIFELLKM